MVKTLLAVGMLFATYILLALGSTKLTHLVLSTLQLSR